MVRGLHHAGTFVFFLRLNGAGGGQVWMRKPCHVPCHHRAFVPQACPLQECSFLVFCLRRIPHLVNVDAFPDGSQPSPFFLGKPSLTAHPCLYMLPGGPRPQPPHILSSPSLITALLAIVSQRLAPCMIHGRGRPNTLFTE